MIPLIYKFVKAKCRSPKNLIVFITLLITLNIIFGGFSHLFEVNYYNSFHYPYDGDVYRLVQQLKHNVTPDVSPINNYTFKFLIDCKMKCRTDEKIRLVYLIKSKPEHFKNRIAIRSTWGYEHRFSDVEIRRVFILGFRDNNELQFNIENEAVRYDDIVQANFTDSYFNNTVKTMMGFKWAMTYCSKAQFYMFVDDDYYVSTKNVLRYIRNPTNYPEYLQRPFDNVQNVLLKRNLKMIDFELSDDVKLYSGYVFRSAPHRHLTSKWYVTLKEYPYHMWPPYVTAGSILLSREALINMYYASYFTKHFKFDDIYVALLALKVNIEPFHCDKFYFYKKKYDSNDYTYVIASHGYDDPEELLKIWTHQKSLGNA